MFTTVNERRHNSQVGCTAKMGCGPGKKSSAHWSDSRAHRRLRREYMTFAPDLCRFTFAWQYPPLSVIHSTTEHSEAKQPSLTAGDRRHATVSAKLPASEQKVSQYKTVKSVGKSISPVTSRACRACGLRGTWLLASRRQHYTGARGICERIS
jgi:hypothetical protein